MDIAAVCEKCAKIFTVDTPGGTLVYNFREKCVSFICTECKHENKFDYGTWQEQVQQSPLPSMGFVR